MLEKKKKHLPLIFPFSSSLVHAHPSTLYGKDIASVDRNRVTLSQYGSRLLFVKSLSSRST